MSDITINNDGSQKDKQKMTPVSESLNMLSQPDMELKRAILQIWQGIESRNITFSHELDFMPEELTMVYRG